MIGLLLMLAVQSPKGADVFGAKAIVAPKTIALHWKALSGEPSVVYNVWQNNPVWQTNVLAVYDPVSTNKEPAQWVIIGYSTNAIQKFDRRWQRIATTTNDFLKGVPMTNSMALFFTSASNTVTRLESPLPKI